MSALVTIIVPSFNSAAFIEGALNSCRAQRHERLELVVTDDGSSDGTPAVVDRWLAANRGRFTRAVLLTSAQNTGTTRSLNRAMHEATGTWIKLLAGDDMLQDSCIEVMLAAHAQSRLDQRVGVVCSRFMTFGEVAGVTLPDLWTEGILRGPGLDRRAYFAMGNFAPAAMILADAIRAVGGFDETYRLLEDTPMFTKIFSAGYNAIFAPKVTVWYRTHAGQITAGSEMLRRDLKLFNRRERRAALGPAHPFYLHAAYELALGGVAGRLPSKVLAALRLADPITAWIYLTDRFGRRVDPEFVGD